MLPNAMVVSSLFARLGIDEVDFVQALTFLVSLTHGRYPTRIQPSGCLVIEKPRRAMYLAMSFSTCCTRHQAIVAIAASVLALSAHTGDERSSPARPLAAS